MSLSKSSSVGFFKNTPWVGPIAEIKFFKGHFKTLNWFGWSFGEAEKSTTEAEVNFMFSYHQFSLVWGGVECYYTLQHYYCALPEHIVGTKISSKLGKNFSIFGGVGYMARAEKFLWSTGIIFINQK